MKTKFSFLRGSLHLDRVLPAILKVIMSRVTVQTKRMLIVHCTCIEKIKMAGRFYGDITPRCIGRTSRTQERTKTPIQPTSVASSPIHRSSLLQRDACEELERPQPSVAKAMTLLGELRREMDALRTRSKITALSKSIENVKREHLTLSQSV